MQLAKVKEAEVTVFSFRQVSSQSTKFPDASRMNIFLVGFYVLCILCAFLYLYTRSALPAVSDAGFNKFQNTYLLVYLLAMGKHVFDKLK